jgi:hypothetical protein
LRCLDHRSQDALFPRARMLALFTNHNVRDRRRTYPHGQSRSPLATRGRRIRDDSNIACLGVALHVLTNTCCKPRCQDNAIPLCVCRLPVELPAPYVLSPYELRLRCFPPSILCLLLLSVCAASDPASTQSLPSSQAGQRECSYLDDHDWKHATLPTFCLLSKHARRYSTHDLHSSRTLRSAYIFRQDFYASGDRGPGQHWSLPE